MPSVQRILSGQRPRLRTSHRRLGLAPDLEQPRIGEALGRLGLGLVKLTLTAGVVAAFVWWAMRQP